VGSIKHGLGDVTKEELTEVSDLSKEIIRDLIIPEIEKEVNEGKVFANLRQIPPKTLLCQEKLLLHQTSLQQKTF